MRQRRARDLAVMNRPIRVGSSGQDTPTELSHPIAMRNRALADAGGQYATTQRTTEGNCGLAACATLLIIRDVT
jgi:hypothetical protein